jgi:hypothetical protein
MEVFAFTFTFAVALVGARPGWLGNVLRDCFDAR